MRNNRGQSMVETALVLPIILLLLMGIFEFGRIFSAYLLVTYTARESVRLASVGKSDTEIVQNVTNRSGLLNLQDIQVIINPVEADRRTGVDVNVTVKYKLTIYTPIIQSLLPNPFEVTAKTYMRVE